MAGKSLLLDIDGVLIRDKLLLNHIKENCVEYVRAKLPDCKNPRETNRALYLSHGHTAIGLNEVFKVDTSDFNEKVYDKNLMSHLAEIIYGTEFQQEAAEIHKLTKNDWRVTLFTNAPTEWATPVARAIGDDVFVASCSYKPKAPSYNNFGKQFTHIFVDDSLKNLSTARWLPNWHCVYYNEDIKEDKLWCPTIQSIWELCLYVNSVDQWILDNHEN
jgi:FMN phosphatase YigB (HAD superfamily)